MRSRASFLIALCTLAICLSSQLVEVFDQWDRTMQTGSDTEYTFAVLALCVGAAYSLRWFAPDVRAQVAAASAIVHPTLDSSASRMIHRPAPAPITTSPPAATLRI
jgi:hypothetical protein